jgi:hypothetical protein
MLLTAHAWNAWMPRQGGTAELKHFFLWILCIIFTECLMVLVLALLCPRRLEWCWTGLAAVHWLARACPPHHIVSLLRDRAGASTLRWKKQTPQCGQLKANCGGLPRSAAVRPLAVTMLFVWGLSARADHLHLLSTHGAA